MKNKLTKLAAGVVSVFSLSAVQAESFTISRIYALGDSLTDGGAYSNAVFLGSGGLAPQIRYRFTNNDPTGLSRTYAEVLASSLGLALPPRTVTTPSAPGSPPLSDPNNGSNGANYAQGGSRVSQLPGIGYSLPYITTLPVTQQVDQFLTDNAAVKPSDLVIIWAGANDAFVQLGAVSGGASTTSAITAMATQASVLAAQIDRIKAAGGKNIVVMLLPDLSQTPFGFLTGVNGQALLSALSNTFNTQLKSNLPGKGVLLIDAARVLNSVIASPARYGFNTNTISLGSTACGLNGASISPPNDTYNSSLTCVNTNPSNYLFADGVHPSTKAHAIFGEVLLSQLRAIPQAVSLMSSPLATIRQQSTVTESRMTKTAMLSKDGTKRTMGNIEVFGGPEFGSLRKSSQQASPSEDSDTQRYLIGLDQQVSATTLVGTALSYAQSKQKYGGNSGNLDTTQVHGMIYAVKEISPSFYVNASYGLATIDHTNFSRQVNLPTTQMIALSKPRGSYQGLRLGGGLVSSISGWYLNPNLSISQEKIRINRFDESGDSHAMSFGDMEYEVQRVSLGFSVQQVRSLGSWGAFAGLIYDWDMKDSDLRVLMGPDRSSIAQLSAPRPSRKNLMGNLGVSRTTVDGSTWTLYYGASNGEDGARSNSIGVNYRVTM